MFLGWVRCTEAQLRLVTRMGGTAGGAELEENPRARSAKLRVAEKCGFDL